MYNTYNVRIQICLQKVITDNGHDKTKGMGPKEQPSEEQMSFVQAS